MDGDDNGTFFVDMGVDEYLIVPDEVWVDDDWAGSNPGDLIDGLCFGHKAFDEIQDAINMISPSGHVRVADGTYTGKGNRNLNFKGKPQTLISEERHETCIIDCQSSGRGFCFENNEGADSVVDGFTIYNGKAPGGIGAGKGCG